MGNGYVGLKCFDGITCDICPIGKHGYCGVASKKEIHEINFYETSKIKK